MKPKFFNRLAIIASILLVVLAMLLIWGAGRAHCQYFAGVNESISRSYAFTPEVSTGLSFGSPGPIFSFEPTSIGVTSTAPSSPNRIAGAISLTATWPELVAVTYTYSLPVRQEQTLVASDAIAENTTIFDNVVTKNSVITTSSILRSHALECELTRFTSNSFAGPLPLRPFTPRVSVTPVLSLEHFSLQTSVTATDTDGKSLTFASSPSFSGWLYGLGIAPQVRFMSYSLNAKGMYQGGRNYRGSVFDIQFSTSVSTFGSIGVGYQWRQGKLSLEEWGADVVVDDRGGYVMAAVVF